MASPLDLECTDLHLHDAWTTIRPDAKRQETAKKPQRQDCTDPERARVSPSEIPYAVSATTQQKKTSKEDDHAQDDDDCDIGDAAVCRRSDGAGHTEDRLYRPAVGRRRQRRRSRPQ